MTATVALKSRVQLYARHWFHCFSVGPKNSERVIEIFFQNMHTPKFQVTVFKEALTIHILCQKMKYTLSVTWRWNENPNHFQTLFRFHKLYSYSTARNWKNHTQKEHKTIEKNWFSWHSPQIPIRKTNQVHIRTHALDSNTTYAIH